MTPHQTQQYLESFINHEIHLDQIKSSVFKLERVEKLLQNLGNPQNDLQVIHVAGSKGKGSICALTAGILKESGYRVGLYTSPHINNYRERIRILNKEQSDINTNDIFPDMISEEDLSNILEKVKPAIEQIKTDEDLGRLSFFEIFTALTLYYFSQQGVDFVILETGLGGRLDATNVVDSMIAVIAPISLEHTQILGDTISDIAKEKAAIIKSDDQKVIIASQEKSAEEVLKRRCLQYNINPIWVEKQTESVTLSQNIHGQVFDLSTRKSNYKKLSLPLLGAHQRDNCTVAVSIVECLNDLGYKILPEEIGRGIENTFWPLRFEAVKERPLIVLDGAHNEASVNVLVNLVEEIFDDKKVTIVFGVSKDKDAKYIWSELERVSRNIIFAKANHPRAGNLPGALSVVQALDLAQQSVDKDDIILVTGSMFVASEARQYLTENILCTN